jgi:hypothetical protein
MREDVQQRRQSEGAESPDSDQPDVVKYKPGSKEDFNTHPENIDRSP